MINILYWNFDEAFEDPSPFVIVIGGRGTGKTYGAVKKIIENKINTVWLRRTQVECDNACNNDTAFLKKYCTDTAHFFKSKTIPETSLYKITVDDIEDFSIIGGAVTTFKNVRGMDFSDYDMIILDELIPERHVKKINGFSEAFLNAYETINRNREIEGKSAVKCIMLSNSNRLDCDLFVYLDIIKDVEKMIKKNRCKLVLGDKGITIIMLPASSEFAEAKKETALYKLTKGTSFYDMSIGNKFAYDDTSAIAKKKLNEYRQYFSTDDVCVWQHKSREEYYVTNAIDKFKKHYANTEADQRLCDALERFWIMDAFMEGKVFFSSYKNKIDLFTYLNVI